MQTDCPPRCARPLNKQGSLPPGNYSSDANCREFTLTVTEQWLDRRNVRSGFLWKRSTRREMLFIPRRTGVIRCKEACRTETIVHVFEVRRARDDTVVSVKWVDAETIANAEFDPGAWHELHQTHG